MSLFLCMFTLANKKSMHTCFSVHWYLDLHLHPNLFRPIENISQHTRHYLMAHNCAMAYFLKDNEQKETTKRQKRQASLVHLFPQPCEWVSKSHHIWKNQSEIILFFSKYESDQSLARDGAVPSKKNALKTMLLHIFTLDRAVPCKISTPGKE